MSAAKDQRPTPALVKEINELAEEAGRIVAQEGLTLGPPDEVLAQLDEHSDAEARPMLQAIFDKIEALKAELARRPRSPLSKLKA